MAKKNHQAKLQEIPKGYHGVFAALEDHDGIPALLPSIDGRPDLRQGSGDSFLSHGWVSLAAQDFE